MSIIASSLYDCYSSIIGLSRTECTCYDPKGGTFWETYNQSYSGLFIDELQPLKVLNSLEECEDNVWEIMDQARENAVKTFVSDGTRSLIQHNKVRVQPLKNVVIGRRTNTSFRNLTTTYAGIHIICKRIVGGYFTLKKVHLNFAINGNIRLRIANNIGALYPPALVPGDINTFAYISGPGVWQPFDAKPLPAPGEAAAFLKLPMWSNYVDNIEYFIYYERELGDIGQQPVKNDLCCNCRNTMTFNPNRPYYVRGHSDAYRWAESMMVGGFDTNDITRFDDLEFNYGGSNFMNGLAIEVDINCDIGRALCTLDESADFSIESTGLNFESDPLAIATAYAILYKTGEYLADHIFASPNMSYSKLINRENLATEQADWIKKYQELIEYIGLETDITKTDCLECKDNLRIEQGTIFS